MHSRYQAEREKSRAVTACAATACAAAQFFEKMQIQPLVALLPTCSLTSLQSIILSGVGRSPVLPRWKRWRDLSPLAKGSCVHRSTPSLSPARSLSLSVPALMSNYYERYRDGASGQRGHGYGNPSNPEISASISLQATRDCPMVIVAN